LTTAELVEPRKGFHSLSLTPPILAALERAEYVEPTPIQAALIPHALEGRDVIGQAQTGTGKTAAFLLPFLDKWRDRNEPGPQAIVLAPTRELAVQVADEAKRLSPDPGFRCAAIYGGQRMGGQLAALRAGCHLVVGTPGRVLDHLSRGSMTLDRVRYAVLDEADRMLDIGFRPDIERILRRCPRERQTLLLSATILESVLRLAHRYMIEPLHINLSPDVLTVDKVRQSYITVDEEKKFELLLRVLARERPRQCIIFCQRKRWADNLYKKLKKYVRPVAVMHGDLPQGQRERIMQAFRDRRVVVLIATDVVGRGIDVMGISHIINYDMPDDPENYVHRIGRTGRMGNDGIAISFSTPEQGKLLTAIEAVTNRLIEEDKIEGFQAFTPRVKVEEAPKPPPAPRFGRPQKRYSNRL
jgi:ATP-dependent RNA helicase DeaD